MFLFFLIAQENHKDHSVPKTNESQFIPEKIEAQKLKSIGRRSYCNSSNIFSVITSMTIKLKITTSCFLQNYLFT